MLDYFWGYLCSKASAKPFNWLDEENRDLSPWTYGSVLVDSQGPNVSCARLSRNLHA